MLAKGERGKATDFSIAAIMAPRGPSFGHYHLQGLQALGDTSNTNVECTNKFDASPTLDHLVTGFWVVINLWMLRGKQTLPEARSYFYITLHSCSA
ncbi:hypothetical protein KQX54_011169 [Cotesia glomerata]|uniref:Uncharacterized protein n=1 Tax=Cotesia glomerata TaxID=32391 RepID=A0AAV7J4P8_COTGL|nr:hypothetical protein KQX54_011169 [Cotesia glomerata]